MRDTLSGKGETGKPKLLDEVRRVLRLRHYSIRTEQAAVTSAAGGTGSV